MTLSIFTRACGLCGRAARIRWCIVWRGGSDAQAGRAHLLNGLRLEWGDARRYMLCGKSALAHWEAGAPAAVGVPRFLGLTGGGAHHAVARAFVRPRCRVTYVLLRPCHPSAAAFRWPPANSDDGILHPRACGCQANTSDACGRPLEVTLDVVDLDTFLAPGTLPVQLRPQLLARVQRRTLRVCQCLLWFMDTPTLDVEVGVFLSTLLGIPILGPQLRVALRTGWATELAASLEGNRDERGEPTGVFHWSPASPPSPHGSG